MATSTDQRAERCMGEEWRTPSGPMVKNGVCWWSCHPTPAADGTWTHQTRAAIALCMVGRPRLAAGSTGGEAYWDPWNTHTLHEGSLTSKVMVDLGSSLCQAYFIMSWDLTSLVLLSPRSQRSFLQGCLIAPFDSSVPEQTVSACLKGNQVWQECRRMDPIDCNCMCGVNMSMASSLAFEGKWHSTACVCLANLPSPTAKV